MIGQGKTTDGGGVTGQRALQRGGLLTAEAAPETALMEARAMWEEGRLALTGPGGGVGSVLLTGKEPVGREQAQADDSHPVPAGQGQV